MGSEMCIRDRALTDLATARGAHLAAVNAAETVVIAAILGGVCRATFVLGTCARRQLTALARAIISRDISGPEEASCASVGPEGLPFGRPVCGLAMRAGARTSRWGAHACCVQSAAGPGAQGESRRKKAKVRVREPKIDGCEIFWRLRANLQTGCAYTTKSVNLTERIEPWFGG